MKKRLFALLLSLAMVLSLLPASAFAEEAPEPTGQVTEGEPQDAVVTADPTEDPEAADPAPIADEGAGEDTAPEWDGATISSVEDLKAFAEAVNAGDTFENKTVTLTADITFGEDDYWYNNATGVNYIISNFAGTFDGNGKTITGMKYYYETASTGTDFAGPGLGLFGTVTGTVKNLTLDTITAELNVPSAGRPRSVFGFLAMNLNGTAENCHVKSVTVTTTGRIRQAGGMFCNVSGTATGCTATNVRITTTSSQAAWTFEDMGGFAGVVTGKLNDCHIDTVLISGNPDRSNYKKVGGMIGRTNNDAVVTNCSAKNIAIYANNQLDHVAGFVGHAEGDTDNTAVQTFTNCSVESVTLTVDKTSSAKVGGFAGEAKGAAFDGCTVADVTINVGAEGGSYKIGSTAGFCGQTNDTGATFTNCSVTGLDMNLIGELENGVGGFLTSTGGSGGTFENCSVTGSSITTTDEDTAVGGFLGNLGWGGEAHVEIKESNADVTIEAPETAPVGTFVGKAESTNANASLEIQDCTAGKENEAVTKETGIGTGDRVEIVIPVAKIGTTEYTTLEAAIEAAAAGDTILVLAAEIELPVINKAGLIFKSEIGTQITKVKENTSGHYCPAENTTFEGFEFTCRVGFVATDLTVKNCKFTGDNGIYYGAAGGTWTITGCEFNNTTYALQIGEGKGVANVTDCTITGGFNTYGVEVNFTGCTFNKGTTYSVLQTHAKMTLTNCTIAADWPTGAAGGHIGIANATAAANGAIVELYNVAYEGSIFDLMENRTVGIVAVDPVKDSTGKYTSGTFNQAPSADLLAEGCEATQNADGTFSLVNNTAPAAKLTDIGRTLSLDAEILVNQYATIEADGYTREYIEANGGLLIWKTNPGSNAVYGTEDIKNEGLMYSTKYKAYGQQSHGIAAKKYADEFWMCIYLKLEDGTYVYTPLKEYSVQIHCETNLGKSSVSDVEKDAFAAMLYYGARVQLALKYNTNDLADANLAEYGYEF